MTSSESDRLATLEAKIDKVLTILDDPDFGVRKQLQDHESRIRSGELWRYSLPAALVVALLSAALTIWK